MSSMEYDIAKAEVPYPNLSPGNYKKICLLGEGGYGEVYKIEDGLGRKFALKKNLHPHSEIIESLKKEFEITRIGLDNVVKGFSHYENKLNMEYCYAMELMDCNLEKYIEDKVLKKRLELKSERDQVDMNFDEFLQILRNIITGSKKIIRILIFIHFKFIIRH